MSKSRTNGEKNYEEDQVTENCTNDEEKLEKSEKEEVPSPEETLPEESSETSSEVESSKDVPESLKVGDRVEVIQGARFRDGLFVPRWMYSKKFYITAEIMDFCEISLEKGSSGTMILHKKYLKPASPFLLKEI